MIYNTINDAQTIAGSGEGALLANRYRVVRQLGQGGMGSVWLAEDTQLDNKPFAIKMLPSILVSNKRAYRQLKDEALVAMKLTHPNIVTLRAFEENNGNPFLVMDYIDGQTLDDYLAEHTGTTGVSPVGGGTTGTTGVSPVATGLPEADVLRILRPIAAALDYAHSEGVVHRDVKPANVMIRKDGHPYILDFGVAREIQETMTRVTGKLSSGTLLYMSPEQNNGDEPTAAQDIYSFAAMAYECLAGRPPFTRGNIEDQIKNKIPDPPPGGTGSIASSVMAGLAKKPEDRPPSCVAVLEGDTSRRDAKTWGGTRVERVGSGNAPPKRNVTWSVFPIICIVAALLVLGGMLWHRGQQRKQAENERWAQAKMIIMRKSEAAKHNKVQLWEGGPYWADRNIGAEKPWDYGYYFWWGDTIGYKRENGAWVASNGSSASTSFKIHETPTSGKEILTLQKEGWITADNVLAQAHDVAHVHWGRGWRMPTKQELSDLQEKCDWKWTPMNGVDGYVVCGRGNYASASIFLPAAGYGDGSHGDGSHHAAGGGGYYWSSVTDSSSYNSWSFIFNSRYHRMSHKGGRNAGQSVRPVQGFAK